MDLPISCNQTIKETDIKRRQFALTLVAGAMALPLMTNAQPGPGPAAGPGPGAGAGKGMGMGMQKWSRERMYGAPMMTLEERQEHQRRMWNAKSAQERNQYRDEHRKLMQERAKQRNFKVDEKQDDVFSVPAITQ
jgi:hypothetical protein